MQNISSLLNQTRPDKELVRLAKEGNSIAFMELSNRYMPILQRRVRHYADVVGVDAEDFVQEGLLALYRAVKGYNPCIGIQFRTYAVTCINNSTASAMKHHMKAFRQQGGLRIDQADEQQLYRQTVIQQGDMSVEDRYIQMESDHHLLRQLEILLSDFERQVLKRYLGGLSYHEIAQVLSTTTKSVDNALQRVRRKLRPEF